MNRRDVLTTAALVGAGLAVPLAATPAHAQAAAEGSTLDRVRKNGVVRIAAIVGQEPYFHKDISSGKWSGGCIDMANDVGKRLNAKVEIVESTWGNQILDLQSNKIDMAFMVNPTPERALVIDFSSPILVHSFCVVTHKGFPRPASWEDLNKPEVKVTVDIGSSHDIIARRYLPKATIMGFQTRDEAVLAVATGRADCNVVLAMLAISTLKKNESLGEIVVPKPVLTLSTNLGLRNEADKRWRDWLSVWSDYNRSLGQTREWLLDGFSAMGVGPNDVPPEVQF